MAYNQILEKEIVLQSHLRFSEFLTADVVNVLIHLFDNNIIARYIENERIMQGLDTSGVSITSEVYGENKNNSTLFLLIKKNNKDFLHLSIHLIVRTLSKRKYGTIHIYKNIYDRHICKDKLYSIMYIKQPNNKLHSLYFSIFSEYTTASYDINKCTTHDIEIQNEINVILTVLNRLFDENNTDYIGNNRILYPIHDKTNIVLGNINNHSKMVTRKNKGVKLYPALSEEPVFVVSQHMGKTKNNRRRTRKIHK